MTIYIENGGSGTEGVHQVEPLGSWPTGPVSQEQVDNQVQPPEQVEAPKEGQ